MTQIEWTQRPDTIGETWNVSSGCNKVDRGCKHCYAEIMHRRLHAMGQAKYQRPFLEGAVPQFTELPRPLTWRKPRTVFVNSMSDLFHPALPFEFIAAVFLVMEQTPQHTYIVLTKRPERALEFWSYQARFKIDTPWRAPANVWVGTSANDQASANKRVPLLLQLHCSVHFLSYEPATGPIHLQELKAPNYGNLNALTGNTQHVDHAEEGYKLDWVICGGESGPKATPMHPSWAQQVRDDCRQTGTAFFFKQWGSWKPDPEGKLWVGDDGETRRQDMRQGVQALRMARTTKKSENLLDGHVYQEFPNPKTAAA